ncbi:MAG TPA: L-threonylcarbamoyladenylate synthase [Candidatus Eremiobacteraceae bacterium]|nr:L-threonylcarbamoyladenylate synthase [Candidatus Eremiobacteraceae bacterium]
MRIVRLKGMPDALLLNETARCVAEGGTIIFPTDTVYGIGCAAENDAAVESIFAAKRRPADKPLAVHLASPELAGRYAHRISPAARKLVETFWPGPLTIIVERKEGVCKAAARGGATIALRCPDDDVCRTILSSTGPLAATSANISGAPAYDGGDDLAQLPEASMGIIAGTTKRRRESTVLDCSADDVRLVRQGALEAADVAHALAGIAPFTR